MSKLESMIIFPNKKTLEEIMKLLVEKHGFSTVENELKNIKKNNKR